MSSSAAARGEVQLDLGGADHRVGQLVGGRQLSDRCSSSDIRRWVMAMDYAYPIHWDHEFARNCEFGGLVAPQSMAAADALDLGHGCQPAGVGRIPGSRRVDDEKAGESSWGLPLVKLKVKLKNRDGSTLVDATALVELTLG